MSLSTYLLIFACAAFSGHSLTTLVVGDVVAADPSKIIPPRYRSEGRLTLMFLQDNKTIKHHLAFSESVDSIESESSISIGYISYSPTRYYVRKGSPILTVNSYGGCSSMSNTTGFVPEFSWFLAVLVPGLNLMQFPGDSSHMIGPSGLLTLLISLTKDVETEKTTEQEIHRNVPCKVFTKNYHPNAGGFALKLDFYMPIDSVQLKGSTSTFFSVKVAAIYDDKTQNHPNNVEDINLMIDFFDIDPVEENPHKIERLKEDLNLPFASGCSEFLEQIQPSIMANSFSLDYRQWSTVDSILVAYDHESGFLRREKNGISVSIWDLNEDLMYHIDTNVTNLIGHQVDFFPFHSMCSVLKVTDDKLGSAFKPYEKLGQSLDVLRMLGASTVAYMGRGKVRDLPCSIYEAILPEAPDLFSLTSEGRRNKSAVDGDYIVQFYLLRKEDPKPRFGLPKILSTSAFWPVQIVLYRRIKNPTSVVFVDQLDIYDFFWSLDGWNKKGNELFMASECFDDEDEQLRLELALTFDRVHHGAVKREDKRILPYNKYKLEFHLVNNVFQLLQTSKMHLVEYELRLRPHHIDLNMVIGDRKENKDLTYFGTGNLPEHHLYLRSQVMLTQMNEEDCILTSSLYTDVSMAVYCEPHHGEYGDFDSTCTMFTEVVPITTAGKDSNKPICQAYRFTPNVIPKRGTISVNDNKFKLIGHQIDFVADMPDGSTGQIIKGSVKNYDISHKTPLIVVNHYAFVIEQGADEDEKNQQSSINQNVRSFDSFSYNSLGDCVKICNLDVNCRSYSYCSNRAQTEFQCILSSLDMRASKLQDQLVHSMVVLSEGKTINITGEQGSNYTLKFMDRCDIYERDYLNMFRQTDEIVSLKMRLINQFPATPTTFECAKQSVDLERSSLEHHVAMFAYCPAANVCILDENLFSANSSSNQLAGIGINQKDQVDQDVSLCRVYRKKYQTYFNISTKVLSRQPDKQIELTFNSIEECARACWNRFGQICASFDYCTPGSCLINQMETESSDSELELRSNCLHYERDLRLDELRKLHLIGRHETLIGQKKSWTFGDILSYTISYFLVFCAFIYGLVLGRQVNDKMEAVTILRQSISAGPGQRARAFSNFLGPASSQNINNSRNTDNTPLDSNPNAIRMSIMKNGNEEDEPLDQDF